MRVGLELRDREKTFKDGRHVGLDFYDLLIEESFATSQACFPPAGREHAARDFRRLFFHRLDRLVRRDCTFQLQSRFYETPPHLAGQTIEARFDPLDPASVEIYFQGQLQGAARLVDPVVNAQLPSTKPSPAPESEPTGINFVDLLIRKKDEEEPPW